MSPREREGLRENAEKKLRERLEFPLRVEIQEHSRVYNGEDWDRILSS